MSENVVLKRYEKMLCYDCDTEIQIPKDIVISEIVTCHSCGLEFEVKQVEGNLMTLEELVIEGEDWGE